MLSGGLWGGGRPKTCYYSASDCIVCVFGAFTGLGLGSKLSNGNPNYPKTRLWGLSGESLGGPRCFPLPVRTPHSQSRASTPWEPSLQHVWCGEGTFLSTVVSSLSTVWGVFIPSKGVTGRSFAGNNANPTPIFVHGRGGFVHGLGVRAAVPRVPSVLHGGLWGASGGSPVVPR